MQLTVPRIVLRLVLLSAVVFGSTSSAAEPKKKPAAAKTALLRIWKSDFASKQAVRIIWRATYRKANSVELIDAADGYRFTGYATVPSGTGVVEVFGTKPGEAALAALPINLSPDTFSTVIVSETAKGLKFQMSDDSAVGDLGELVVRNFVPTLSGLKVDAGPNVHLVLQGPDSFLHLRGLAREKFELNASGEDSAGQPVYWTSEIDLTRARRVSLLIYPDHYGRIRPRAVIDGEVVPSGTDTPEAKTPSPAEDR